MPRSIQFRVALCSAAAVLAAGLPPVRAEGLRTEKNISLEIATQIAAATVADCQTRGCAVGATVVDRGASVRVVYRADNAGPHTLASAARLRGRSTSNARWPGSTRSGIC